LSGVCSTFYLDSDGDGYGVGVGLSQCGTTPPTGYANKAGDCCDSDKNAFPGQTAYFTTADACSSFDYNCDAQETPKIYGPSDCGTISCVVSSGTCTYAGGCNCGGSNPCLWYSRPACGAPYYVVNSVCNDITGTGCVEHTNGGVAGNQECN
jgi:hypothetical protein